MDLYDLSDFPFLVCYKDEPMNRSRRSRAKMRKWIDGTNRGPSEGPAFCDPLLSLLFVVVSHPHTI